MKFLRSKEGTAMVEMGDVSSANCALANLPMIKFGDLTLNVTFSIVFIMPYFAVLLY